MIMLLLVDDSVSKPEQMARKQIKEKFSNRPNTAAVMQFRDNPVSVCTILELVFVHFIRTTSIIYDNE